MPLSGASLVLVSNKGHLGRRRGQPPGVIEETLRMDDHTTVELLEELAERFGIQIRYEPIRQDEDLVKVVGGLCLLRGEYVLIIDSKAAMRDKIRTFAEALRHFDLDQIYLKPALRELLDKVPASFRHDQAVIGEENI